MLTLIDVSNNNGLIDWKAVAESGIAGAFIKASEGNYFTDRYFARNWHEAKAYGLWRAAYHFARPSFGTTAEQEAYYFLDIVLKEGIETGDGLVIDNEDEKFEPHLDVTPWVKFFCELTENVVGFPTIHYTGPWYIDTRIKQPQLLVNNPLWLATYPDVFRPENWPQSFREVDFWQFSSAGAVPGVSGDCDLNVFRGTIDDLKKYGKPAPQIVTLPTPTWEAQRLRDELSLVEDLIKEISEKSVLAQDKVNTLREMLANLPAS